MLSNKTADFISRLLEVFPHWSCLAQTHCLAILCVWLVENSDKRNVSGPELAGHCVHLLISHHGRRLFLISA